MPSCRPSGILRKPPTGATQFAWRSCLSSYSKPGGGSLFVLAFVLKREAHACVSFRLKTATFTNRALESSKRRLAVALFAQDASFNRRCFCINGAVSTCGFDLCERTVRIVQIKQQARQTDVRRRETRAQLERAAIEFGRLFARVIVRRPFARLFRLLKGQL